jgi:hypothetical protein
VRGRVLVLVLAFALLLSCMAGLARRADANFIGAFVVLPAITIQSDGSVVPQTEYVTREGNVYSLTEDLQQTYVININCSNITFDGQGHVINGTQPDKVLRDMGAIGYYSNGIYLENVTNVTVKDIRVFGFTSYQSIYIKDCNEISILDVEVELIRLMESDHNMISSSSLSLSLEDSNYNVILRNNLTLGVSCSSENLIYQNNIFSSPNVNFWGGPINRWDNGSVGNHWSDYFDRYPDALEIGVTGVADMPYVIDESNVDNYPLMRPVSTEQETEAAPFIVTIVAGVSTIIIAGATAGFVYQKKHGSRRKSDNRIAE